MSNVRYEITGHRNNGFYQYTKYVDNAISKEGWGLYSHIMIEDERPLWIKAVNEYNDKNNIITKRKKLHNAIDAARNALEIKKKQFPENDPLIMKSFTDLLNMVQEGAECNDDLIENILKLNESSIPTPKNMFRYTVNTAWSNTKNTVNKALHSFAETGVDAFVLPVLDLADGIVDTAFGIIDAVALEISLLYSDIIYYYKMFTSIKFKLSDEEKEFYKKKFYERLNFVGKEIKDYIFTLLCIDEFIILFNAIKDLDGVAADVWSGFLKKLRSLKDIKIDTESETVKILMGFLASLIPLLGAMVGALLAAKCSDNALATTEEAFLEEAKKLFPSPKAETTSDTGKNSYTPNPNAFNLPTCYDYAVKNENNFSLYPIDDNSPNVVISNQPNKNIETRFQDNETPIQKLCKLSMCNPFEPTDTDSMGSESGAIGGVDLGTANPLKFIVEVPRSAILLPKIGQKFSSNDIIGYDKTIPIKSTFNGIVEEKYDNYIKGSYFVDDVLFSGDQKKIEEYIINLTSSVNTKEYDAIIEVLNTSAHIDTFIKDVMPYIKFPELAMHTREHAEGNSVSLPIIKFTEKYEEEAQEIIDKHHDNIKKICDKDNVSYYAENELLLELKSQIDSEKKFALGKLITLWNSNPGSMKYCSEGKISDFMLYDLYIDFLTSENFIYDENNPYIEELNNAITDFLSARTRLELNADNINGLVEKFNDYSDSVLKPYWQYNDITYYDKLSELFIHNYYKTDSLLAADDADKEKDSMYKKVLEYLKAVVKYTPQNESTVEIDLESDNVDISKILENEKNKDPMSTFDADKMKMEQSLKRISHMFVSLRKIETGVITTESVPFISEKALKAFNNLKKVAGDSVYEYHKGKKYITLNKLYRKEKVLEEFLKALQQQTSKEISEITRIVNSALTWYQKNSDDISSGKIFEQYKMILLPPPSIIYHNNIPHDYYLVQPYAGSPDIMAIDKNSKQPGRPIRADITDANGNPLKNNSVYPDTQYDPTTWMYWLRYCAMATLVNCMIPLYWSTGLVIAGAPVLLPIIYIPIIVIPAGKVTVVIGIGLCGIMPQPMLLFVNQSSIDASMLIPITMILDMLINMLNKFKSMQFKAIEISLKPLITALDNDISDSYDKIEDINYQISMLKTVSIDRMTLKELKARAKEDYTTMKKDPNNI